MFIELSTAINQEPQRGQHVAPVEPALWRTNYKQAAPSGAGMHRAQLISRFVAVFVVCALHPTDPWPKTGAIA